jgi:predicted GIY-YIG superfamily endonuclease
MQYTEREKNTLWRAFPRVESNQAYVYVLRECGRGAIRYIGISSFPYQRFKNHRQNLDLCSADTKRKWIERVGRNNITIEVIALAERPEARRIEKALVLSYGLDKLTNGSYHFSKSERLKYGIIR